MSGTNGTSKRTETVPSTPIPALCRYWRATAHSLPVVKLCGLDVSMTIASALALTVVRYTAEYTMIHVFGWPSNMLVTKSAASSVAAMVHSLLLVPALAVCFLYTDGRPYNPSQRLSDAAEWWQDTVTALIQFCTGYMLYDGLVNILWLKSQMVGSLSSDDCMFLGHHVATILYMVSTRLVASGHQSAMMCMFLGELTNPLHNAYYVAQAAQTLDCCNGPWSQSVYHVIHVAFSALYCGIRVVVGPVAFAHISYHTIWVGRRHIPFGLIVFWNVLIWAVVWGSLPWVYDCWATLQRTFPLLGHAKEEL